MIKQLIHDPIFLAGKSEVATKEDLQVVQDSLDTLMAHKESCVGMAANMIGVRKRMQDTKAARTIFIWKRTDRTALLNRRITR